MSNPSSESASSSGCGDGDTHALGASIQSLVDRLVKPFVPLVEELAAGATPGGWATVDLAEAAIRGLREGVIGYAINGCTGSSFAVSVCAAVRKRAAICLRDGRGADCDPDEWLDAHFSEPAIRERLGLPDSDAGIASAIDEMQRLANQIVRMHHHLAKAVARMFRHCGRVSDDDLEQEAAMGLRKAALSYRPADGTPFAAYARLVIRHHLSSVVRTASGATDYFARRIEEFTGAKERLAHEWGRQPNEDEVFEALRWDGAKREKVRAVMRILNARALPTAAERDAGVAIRCPRPDPQQEAAEKESATGLAEKVSRLSAALERLPEDQREIIRLRYFGNLSFREIGEQVRLTERQVRTRHNNALETLKREVEGAGSVSRSRGSA